MKLLHAFFLCTIVLFFAVIAPPVRAFEVRGGESVTVPAGQVIEGSLFIGGTSVSVEGTVNGDVFCGGSYVVVTGKVTGDVLCAAQDVRIDGVVLGDVRLVGQSVAISGSVEKNATTLGQSVIVTKTGSVSGELLAGTQSLIIDGVVGVGVLGGAQSVIVNGRVGGDVRVMVESLTVGDGATIYGALSYTSEKEATIAKSASVSGSIVRDIPKTEDKKEKAAPKALETKPWPANALPGIFFYVLIAAAAAAVFPGPVSRVLDRMKGAPVAVGLKGLLTLMVVPMAILFFFLTILGIPVALLLGLAYAFAIAVSRIFPAMIVGGYIIESFFPKRKEVLLLNVLVGVPILWFITKAPFVGGIISFLVVIWGLGGMVVAWRSGKK